MKPATASAIMLALRSPKAGWLGVLACVIDEASRDANFDENQRQLAMQLLESGPLPSTLANAAQHRADCFEAELDAAIESSEPAEARPKLTLVGQ